MKTMGFSDSEFHDIFRLVSAILWIGNLDFVPDQKGQSAISDQQSAFYFLVKKKKAKKEKILIVNLLFTFAAADMVSYLLQVDPQCIQQALLFRTITTGNFVRWMDCDSNKPI
jgi:myosin heavy subunit